ncbi:retinol dehydrogenase 12-like [Euwallacea similis]|uniref:retinol dehydrogenase 12-like n=1 Tax=Euwallacea similis TaxID=1736056 RepID=UPI00344F030F
MRQLWKYITGCIAIGSAVYGLIKYFSGGVCRCSALLTKRVVIITGANSGIGKALAVELAKKGAILILACRDIKKGCEAKSDILREVSNPKAKIFVKHLDLCSLSSIRKFVLNVSEQFRAVYALVNCAGVFYHPFGLTADGFETTFQTNYLGPFVLTHCLLPLFQRHLQARVINVVSEAHRRVNVYDLKVATTCQEKKQLPYVAYGVSKLALLLFTREFAKLPSVKGSNIIVNAVNPGNVETPIYRHFPALANPWLFAIQKPIRLLVVKTPKQGCQSILHALLTTNTSTGQYYSDCKLSLASPIATSDKIARDYYHITLNLLNWPTNESRC